ncbi:Spo11_Type II DNA topoisomerase VI subunit A [Hexamita inflata]|uniref:DNA topoisomerase (ATP-hydrolyzing) n=1 Tax=Hexamita inflata TaxID=28002 RepID=A0AA86UX88_9EUKA|nr:Spo11 Type II DNA topoisomerase VI subunit A [Hexamita inflata]
MNIIQYLDRIVLNYNNSVADGAPCIQINTLKVTQPKQVAQFLSLINCVIQQLQSGDELNIRSFYYQSRDLFDSQSQSNSLISKFIKHSGLTRQQLLFTITSKGQIFGPAIYTFIDTSIEANYIQITSQFNCIEILFTTASFLLIVEKDTIFQALRQNYAQIQSALNMDFLILTARGQPDLQTREFVNFISKNNHEIQIFGLADCNSYGQQILFNYCFGSKLLVGSGKLVPIGLFESINGVKVQNEQKLDRIIFKLNGYQRQQWISNILQMKTQTECELDELIKEGVLIEYVIEQLINNLQ